ncbi:MAG: molybdopterin-binding protein [Deltaproteobacteria bacterium]|nr:molybdopterin-binding protein [Deltaproteobacteria bacterium]
MRKIRVQDAIGETLCHDMTAILESGFKGVRFKRGHVISAEDIPAMLDMGKFQVFVWEPEADEVHEDDAAMAVTEAMCGKNVTSSGPTEGKMEIRAASDGLFCLNREALKQMNRVGDYTIACRPGYTRVAKGDLLAGARIIPLVTKRRNVDEAVRIAKANDPVLAVLPFKPLKTGIVITGSEIYHGRIKDAFEPILRAKLAGYGAEILGFRKCPDDLEMILAAIKAFLSSGAELILLTGGMSVDPDDLTPTAIRTSGARLVTQGVPMQGGNMLTMAYLDKTMLIGVPGASMRAPTTSLEVFLPRVFAGIEITEEEIAGYGEGGLCLGCKVCRHPLCWFGTGR